MKIIKVQGKILRNGDFFIRSARDIENGVELNSPSTLVNLIRLRKKLREPLIDKYGFEYTFPFAFAPRLSTNGFKAEFPLIFE